MHNILPHNAKENDKKNSKWFYEKSDAIIFHHKSDIDRSKKLLKTNIDKEHIIIPHGNFNDLYEDKISENGARKILNIPENKKIILCFGVIRENRGYEYLIESTKEMQDIIIIIAGKSNSKYLCRKLNNYVKKTSNLRLFIKWIPDNEIQIYFKASDIVVLPYTEIYTSGVVPLAYAFRRPVITTNIGFMYDVINEKTGILVPPKDSKALKEAIERMFKMDYKTMGNYAYNFASSYLNWDNNAKKINELYKILLNKKIKQNIN
jgi:glycosyltransferase involved in cell wall biosynthesis